MTDSQTHELVGRKREEYRLRKKERAALKAKAGDLAKFAATIGRGLESPELIRWWDGTPFIGQRSEHVILTSAMFAELKEETIKQICGELKGLDAIIGSLREEITEIDEDPER